MCYKLLVVRYPHCSRNNKKVNPLRTSHCDYEVHIFFKKEEKTCKHMPYFRFHMTHSELYNHVALLPFS